MSNLATFEQKKAMMRLEFPTPVAPPEMQPRDLNGNLMFTKIDKYDFNLTVSDAIDWIREKKGIECGVYPNITPEIIELPNGTVTIECKCYGYDYIFLDKANPIAEHINIKSSDTHPLAESALLAAVLNYLIEKENLSNIT